MKRLDIHDRPFYLTDKDLSDQQWHDYRLAFDFLISYGMRSNETFNSYRNDVHTLLLWAWLISEKKTLKGMGRRDVEDFLDFCHEPPREWVSSKRQKHFIGSGGDTPNESWRPFRVPQDSLDNRSAKIKRSIAHTSLLKTFSSLNSFFDYLMEEDYIDVNPIPSVKRRSPYLVKDAQIKSAHRLSEDLWYFLLDSLEEAANRDSYYERCLFAVVLMKTCYLRISELAERDAWSPVMGHFFEQGGAMWLKVYGKGKKIRDVTVPDSLLPYLTRFRESRGLSALPEPKEQHPLIPKEKGIGNVGKRQLTRIIQEGIDLTADKLKVLGRGEDADMLSNLTTHWLRHTGASMDVNTRPLKHLSDELGHASLATTDRIYVQSDQRERARTGKTRSV